MYQYIYIYIYKLESKSRSNHSHPMNTRPELPSMGILNICIYLDPFKGRLGSKTLECMFLEFGNGLSILPFQEGIDRRIEFISKPV